MCFESYTNIAFCLLKLMNIFKNKNYVMHPELKLKNHEQSTHLNKWAVPLMLSL